MMDKIKAFLFNEDLRQAAPAEVQGDIDGIDFDNIYEAVDLARQINYSFVATIGRQRWRVYPGKSPKLVAR